MNEQTPISSVPRLEALINENGDLVYRRIYSKDITIIRKADIERLLNGKALDNTSVWEVIAAWDQEKLG